MNACGQMGFAVWAEIPFISVFKSGKDAHEHCRRELTELIVQNYNHPSIMFWGISNEILIGGISQELVDCHHDLQRLCKELDPTRLTTIAHVSFTPVSGPMHHITDVESYNHYFGWYGGKIEDNAPWLDKFHADNPDICIGVSEYGCEGIINWHSNKLSVRIILKNIRHCIMNTWHRCLRIAHGSGQVMSGICLILDVLPEMKAECVDAIIKDLSRLTVKRVKTAFTCTRHIGVKSRWYILQDAVMHSAQVRLLR